MKTLYKILFIALVVMVYACQKDGIGNGKLTGKWKLSETYTGTGGATTWMPADPKNNSYVQFNANYKLEGTAFPDIIKYAFKDTVTLIFYKKDYSEQYFRYSIKNNVLEMNPAGPVFCTEGCGSRFVKQSD